MRKCQNSYFDGVSGESRGALIVLEGLDRKSLQSSRLVSCLEGLGHSAELWRSLMEAKLKGGTTLVVYQYLYLRVAFSSAKGLNIEWCKAPEIGLLAPDLVLYLDIAPEKAAERGAYGGERHEQVKFQKKVAERYRVLRGSSWKVYFDCSFRPKMCIGPNSVSCRNTIMENMKRVVTRNIRKDRARTTAIRLAVIR
ncbi:hypothetical protein CDL15_Pgr021489 [Punica granatum]|uniref:Thymidylate kinase-like domain-containing protein n=1 Tax=Punica granatum TaxID=22663 RepID=A0A218XN81_PUNGR|nr:hypothetical protein CDL15_Pgr021489 [Punica granatum]